MDIDVIGLAKKRSSIGCEANLQQEEDQHRSPGLALQKGGRATHGWRPPFFVEKTSQKSGFDHLPG